MMTRQATRMYNANKFKLGLFAPNCSGGLTMTKAPERWEASWDNNVTVARLADDAGLEFLLPVGRWHGYHGETDTEGTSFETLTWASGLLASTRELCVFGTLHVAFVNPVFAAKQIVTADHIGKGRFGLNIVSGWNAGEFDMFGIPLKEHDRRYAYTEEWLNIIKRIWSDAEPFDAVGENFRLKAVEGKPKPYFNSSPLLISAANSADGRAFAVRHADCLFTTVIQPDTLAKEIAVIRSTPGAKSTDAGVYGSGHMICRPTRKEAEDYYHYIVYEMGDWEAAEHTAVIRTKGRDTPLASLQRLKERLISGLGTYPIVGSYDDAAEAFNWMSQAGLTGMAIGLVNYITDFPALRDEVLPRMERLGLRQPMRAAGHRQPGRDFDQPPPARNEARA
jgi:alkanesulfonate monooxygenase SsuD/methylene tetrahydromethanopterin reductase-like flavin-dependent oxidoreductase (luciferase family)